jgi:hypothetical protein
VLLPEPFNLPLFIETFEDFSVNNMLKTAKELFTITLLPLRRDGF